MDEDVKTQNAETPQAEIPADQGSQPDEQTPESPETPLEEQPQERTVPLAALQEERKRAREAQRELAELRSAQQINQYDPEDLDQILQHPMVQELILKEAKRELTDYTSEVLEQYPGINSQVKKAILRNVRGFVNESTTDLETAKMDILEHIEEMAAEVDQTPEPQSAKGFKVATTNVPTTQATGVKPAEIENILNKSVDSWTDEEVAAVEAYSRRSIK